MERMIRRNATAERGAPDSCLANDRESVIVQGMVAKLNALCRRATLRFALAVGELVIRHLYEGDLDLFRRRAPKGELSLRRLASHPDLAMSWAGLYRSIAIYELCERLGVPTWHHISSTHLRLVLPLAPSDQEQLLRAAESHRWPVRRLEDEVAKRIAVQPMGGRRGGRRRASRLRRMLGAADRSLAAVASLLEGADDARAESSPESVRDAVDLLQRLGSQCTRLESQLTMALAPHRDHSIQGPEQRSVRKEPASATVPAGRQHQADPLDQETGEQHKSVL